MVGSNTAARNPEVAGHIPPPAALAVEKQWRKFDLNRPCPNTGWDDVQRFAPRRWEPLLILQGAKRSRRCAELRAEMEGAERHDPRTHFDAADFAPRERGPSNGLPSRRPAASPPHDRFDCSTTSFVIRAEKKRQYRVGKRKTPPLAHARRGLR